MNLYKKLYKIKANNSNKEVDIEKIITIFLKKVRKEAMEQIKYRVPNLNEKNIHWVIAVPEILDIISKQIMINSAQNAGLIRDDDDLLNCFVLKYEAASLYYYYCSKYDVENNGIDDGNPFILCDIGDEFFDIISLKKIKKNNEIKYEELYPSNGGEYGCNKINEYFKDRVIKELFGEIIYNKTKDNIIKNKYNDWLYFERNIELFQRNFVKIEQLGQYFIIDCDIFIDEINNEEELEKLIDKFNLRYPSWKLDLDRRFWKILFLYQIINDLMLELINKIINNYIMPTLNSINDIKTIIFMCESSSNRILFNMIKKDKKLMNLNIINLPNPEVALSYGPVLYLQNHYKTNSKKQEFPFKIKPSEIWDYNIYKKGIKKFHDKMTKYINA